MQKLKGFLVKIKKSHGLTKFHDDVGIIEKYVPFDKYYIHLQNNGRSVISGEDFFLIHPYKVDYDGWKYE